MSCDPGGRHEGGDGDREDIERVSEADFFREGRDDGPQGVLSEAASDEVDMVGGHS